MSQVRDHVAATLVDKVLFGWVASMAVVARRGNKEALLTRQCRLGCNAEETNWHVLAECKYSEVVTEGEATLCGSCTYACAQAGGSNGCVAFCEGDHGSVVGSGRKGLCQRPEH